MTDNPYKQLAVRLDTLPNGFPATDDGVELRILESLFTPEEAALAAQLRMSPESAEQVALRVGGNPSRVAELLGSMAMRGIVTAVTTKSGQAFRLMPFVVGFYESQVATLSAELAALFEAYYHQAFAHSMETEPQLHRVIPVGKSFAVDIEVQPYESAAEIVNRARAWGIVDCICRKQKALIGDPCDHPVDICIVLSPAPGAFDENPAVRALTNEEALGALQRAEDAGLVHTTANNQKSIWYICNCCTCSCGFLRGMAELGMANVIARSAFVCQVDTDLCSGCEDCIEHCQFDALALDRGLASIDRARCVGCGLCVRNCLEDALSLVHRPEHEIKPVPLNEAEWGSARAANRGIDLAGMM